MIDEEFVTKSRKASAGLFRERCEEIVRRKRANVCRQDEGNEISRGSRGEYHQLGALASLFGNSNMSSILDIIADYRVRQVC